MPYLIDGHNLIGALPSLALDDPHDEAKLVLLLRSFAARTRKKCVVVFDSGMPGGASRLSTASVRVIFAGAGQEADAILLRRIRKERNPAGWVLVSADRRVRAAARQQRMKWLSNRQFARLLASAPVGPTMAEMPDDPPGEAEVEGWLREFGADKG